MIIAAWIALGLVVGRIARSLVPPSEVGEPIVTTAFAIAGAVVGGWSWSAAGFTPPGEQAWSSLAGAAAGAIVLAALWKLLVHGKPLAS